MYCVITINHIRCSDGHIEIQKQTYVYTLPCILQQKRKKEKMSNYGILDYETEERITATVEEQSLETVRLKEGWRIRRGTARPKKERGAVKAVGGR